MGRHRSSHMACLQAMTLLPISLAFAASSAWAQPLQLSSRICGRVVLPDGSPAMEAQVFVEVANTRWESSTLPETYPSGLDYACSTNTAPRIRKALAQAVDADGRFEITVRAPNTGDEVRRFIVEAFGEGFPPVRVEAVPCEPDQTVELPEAIRLSPGQMMRGRVSNEDGGAVEDARVTAYWPNYAVGGMVWGEGPRRHGELTHALTDADGRYELGPLAPGHYDVWVTAEGAAPAGQKDLIVSDDARPDTDFGLPPLAEIDGVLLYRGTDDPIEGVEVSIGLNDARERREAVSNADGLFVLPGLCAGKYTMWVRTEEYAVPSLEDRTVDVAEGEIAVAEIELWRGGAVEGLVTDVDGTPVEGVGVLAYQRVGDAVRGHRVAMTDADGHFHADHTRPGEYWFGVELIDGRKGESEPVPLEDDEEPVLVEIIVEDQ